MAVVLEKVKFDDKTNYVDDPSIEPNKKLGAEDVNELKKVTNEIVDAINKGDVGAKIRVGGEDYDTAAEKQVFVAAVGVKPPTDKIVVFHGELQEDGTIDFHAKANNVSIDSAKYTSKDVQGALIEEAAFRPQSGLLGEELADTQLELIELSEAEAIAQQRGLATDDDHRLFSSGISQDGIGLDRLLTGDIGAVNEQGLIVVPDGTDPLTLTVAGRYGVSFKDGTLPYVEMKCIVDVVPISNDDIILYAHYRHDGTVWKNCKSYGIWSGWKLIAGEVKLYEGSAATEKAITLSMDRTMFGSFYVIAGDYISHAVNSIYNTASFGANIYSSRSDTMFFISGYLNFSNNKTATISSMKRMRVQNSVFTNEVISLTQIVGRP